MSSSEPVPPDVVQAALSLFNIGWPALGPAIAFCGLAFIVVLARWWTRLFLIRAVGKEDFLISVSMMLMIGHTIVVANQFRQDGKIQEEGFEATAADAMETVKFVLTANTIYCVATNITKASIVSLYLRVFHEKAFPATRWTCFIILFLLLISATWGVFGGIFLCQPVRKLWDFDLPGSCLSAQAYWVSFACANVVLDFAVWVLPMPLVRKLKLPPKRMRLLSIIFFLGGFVCIVCVVRVAIVRAADLGRHYARSGVDAVMWTSIEANTGIICACLLCLKPLILRIWPSLLGDSRPPRHNLHLPTFGQSQTTFLTQSTTMVTTTVVGSRNDSPFKGMQQSPASPTSTSQLHPPEVAHLCSIKENKQLESSKRGPPTTPYNNSVVSLSLPQRSRSSRSYFQKLNNFPKQQRSMPDLNQRPSIFVSDSSSCTTTIAASGSNSSGSRSSPGSIIVDTEMVQTEEYITPSPTLRPFAESSDARSQREKSFTLDIPDIPVD